MRKNSLCTTMLLDRSTVFSVLVPILQKIVKMKKKMKMILMLARHLEGKEELIKLNCKQAALIISGPML